MKNMGHISRTIRVMWGKILDKSEKRRQKDVQYMESLNSWAPNNYKHQLHKNEITERIGESWPLKFAADQTMQKQC